MPSAFRFFPGHVAVLGDTWIRMVHTSVTWTPTGKGWGSESKPFVVSDGHVLAIAKPGEAKGDEIARAAHEKIASDLAYHLDLPVPPAVLWRRAPCPQGAHPYCSISAIAYAQPLDLGPNMQLITGPLLNDARRITSAIAAFDSWIGAQDRHPGNAIIDADTSGGLRMAFIDYAYSLSHTWKASPGKNQFVNTFATYFGGVLPAAVEEVVDRIVALAREAIENCVGTIPDDFMSPADRQLVLDQLLRRRATLRSVCGLPRRENGRIEMAREVRCALAPIRIYTDMSQPGGREILVGYVAELTTPEHRVMGLVGRQTLDVKEMTDLHGLLRSRAAALWDFLSSEFELACGVKPGEGLEYLASRHSFALSFEAPERVAIPKSLADAALADGERLEREFRSFLWKQAEGDLIQHESGIQVKTRRVGLVATTPS